MNANEILRELSKMGSPQTKSILMRHGAQEPLFGVKVEDPKKIQKRVKKDHALSLDLFATGNADAMYLAGLIADEKLISKKELEDWAKSATSPMLREYTVSGVAAESAHGWELGMKWIDARQEDVRSTGWATLSHCVSLSNAIDRSTIESLLARVETTIGKVQNRERYTMNTFVICVGGYVPELTKLAKATAKRIGKVEVSMGQTSCKVPDAFQYIEKMEKMGRLGKKKKQARC